MERALRSTDIRRAHSCYDVLAMAICHSDKGLLPDDEIQTGLEVAAQQIAWGVPKQLVTALQTVSFAAEYRFDLLTSQSMELILAGLSQLLEQTRISSDDTVATASEKGNIRRWAVSLAMKLEGKEVSEDGREILNCWLAIRQDKMNFPKLEISSDNKSRYAHNKHKQQSQDATLGTVVIQNLFTDFEMPSQRKGLGPPS